MSVLIHSLLFLVTRLGALRRLRISLRRGISRHPGSALLDTGVGSGRPISLRRERITRGWGISRGRRIPGRRRWVPDRRISGWRLSVARLRGISGLCVDDADGRPDGVGRECFKLLELAPVLGDGTTGTDPVDAGIVAYRKRHPACAPDVLPRPCEGDGPPSSIPVAARALLAPSFRPVCGLRAATATAYANAAPDLAIGPAVEQTRRKVPQ
jgi:hypothetical protein